MSKPLKRHAELEALFGSDFLPISKSAPKAEAKPTAEPKAAVMETFGRTASAPASRLEAGLSEDPTDTAGLYVASVDVNPHLPSSPVGCSRRVPIDYASRRVKQ